MTNLGRRLRELVLWAGAALGLLAVTAGVLVAFFGFNLLVFRSGSMSPEIPTGGIALSRTVAAQDVRDGDVVSVIADNGERVTHRVVSTTLRGDEASLVLRGDANASPDTELYVVTTVDRVVASLPYGGYVVVHALTPPGILAVACLSMMLLLLAGGREKDETNNRPEDDDGPERQPKPEGETCGEREVVHQVDQADDSVSDRSEVGYWGRLRAPVPLRQRVRTLAVAVVVLGVGGLAIAHTSGTSASFTDKPITQAGSFVANKFFTCDAFAKGAGSPYLYWKLDESSLLSAAADSSGNGRTGAYNTTLGSGVSLNAAKACAPDTGSAATLNGSTGYLNSSTLTSVAGPNTFSLSMWFKTNTLRGGKLIGFGSARTGSSGQYDRHIYMQNDGKLVFGVYPSAVKVVTSPLSYNDNVWHHVVATLSTAGMRLYVDGALVASDATVTAGESYSGFWRVGYDNLGAWVNVPTSSYFAGTIDEVAVYTTALSAGDIAAGFAPG